MFDSPVLNVVIGLTLIYLLYSLLASLLGELLSTTFNLRSLLLRVALERMLNDGYYARRDKWRNRWSAIVNAVRWFFLFPNSDFKNSLAGRFYEHPSIKYLAKAERRSPFAETRPSYLTDVYFVSTFIRMLIEMGMGNTDDEKIASALKLNTLHMQPRTAKNVTGIYQEAKGDTAAFKEGLRRWYNETMDRANGWYKRKMQFLLLLIGLLLSILFNVDTIRITKLLARDPDARSEMVKMSIAIANDTTIENVITDKDSLRRAAILDSGYAHVQRDIEDAGLLLGLGWNFDQLSSPIEYKVVHKKTPKLSDGLLELDAAAKSVRVADSMHRASEERNCWAVKTLLPEIKQTDRQILDIKMAALQGSIKDTSKVKELRGKKDTLLKLLDARKEMLANDSLEFAALGYIICNTFKDLRLLGFLLTALMISLGAPFWFDLLKKLVSLRGAGVRPEPSDNEVLVKKVLPDANAPAVVVAAEVTPLFATVQDEFVWKYRASLLALPSVRAVFTFYDNDGNCKVQVNVTEAAAEQEVRDLLTKLGINPVPGWLLVKVTGIPRSNAPLHAVGNFNNMAFAHGSLSCILKDSTNEDRFVLSCWHVLKGDTDFDALFIRHPLVVNNTNTIIADLEVGGILNTLDYGLARCRPNMPVITNDWLIEKLELSTPFKHRLVETDDIKKHITLRYFDVETQAAANGIIYAVCPEVQVDYRDKSRMVQDVIVLQQGLNTVLPISQPGNSGALLFDAKNDAIGMIIAGDENYTYAIKLSNFFNLHKEKSFA
ncbi:hypothetical protein SAMN04488505_10879 [Chitinophaga rupis]|uniref:Trypsin-like peptidase domain-containing protein n=1 Tax=Chitinophaga rupis TaxID=573321 RepID=A0A1H8DTB1_9BACT|nr:hypothetical protein [Chitinophaga rupis]SEN09778.1 hypothetical protein SAMN04488505_10879 [Chitinophaga rupis]